MGCCCDAREMAQQATDMTGQNTANADRQGCRKAPWGLESSACVLWDYVRWWAGF